MGKRLSEADARLARIIEKVGPVKFEIDRGESVFESIGTSILYQQLTGKAAGTILGRLKALYPGKDFPSPEDILATDQETLRGVGLSRAKAAAVQDLAFRVSERMIPTREEMESWNDESIIEKLIEVRGVGRWTVEMFLIFTLGREDVLPVSDYGVRKGYAMLYGKKELPTPKELLKLGEKWKPFRSAASWYLWRVTEMPEYQRPEAKKAAKKAAKKKSARK